MSIELNNMEKSLLELLMKIPSDLTGAEKMLSAGELTPENVTKVGIAYADECFDEVTEFIFNNGYAYTGGVVPGLHSTSIVDVIRLLLRFGLNPNGVYDGNNIMDSLQFVDNEYLSADALDLLLQHGGNLNLELEDGPFFRELDFRVAFDAVEQYNRRIYSALIHFWMVAVGNGASYIGNKDKLFFYKEYNSDTLFDPKKLRNHRNYSFCLAHLDKDFAISIYDRDTLWEVARLV